MWKLVIADDEGQKTVVNLVREEYSLGRAEGNSVRLTERNISRKHALIRRTPGGFRVEDVTSYNGLFVNGVRVVGNQDLAHGDVIQLGDYRIQVIDEAIDTQEQGYRLMAGESTLPASGRLPHRLVELIGPNQGAEYPLEGARFLIGRGPECEFPIDHGSVSRVHAEIRTIGDGTFEVIDKGSANGLRVNGHTLDRAILDSRDVIELGDVVLKYIPEGQVFQANAEEGARIAALAGSSLPPAPSKKPRLSLLPALLAALLGAIAMSAVVVSYTARKNQAAHPDVPKELSSVASYIERGDLLGAGHEFEKLGAAERALAAYEALETRWAETILGTSPEAQGNENYRHLLDMVSRRETLSEKLRERANKKLIQLDSGAIDLSTLEEGAEAEATADPP
jgi:pSer/pThr/pTyr-binding forkhead associated (FHA) protein